MFGIKPRSARLEAASLIVRERPSVLLDVEAVRPTPCETNHMAEYAEVTKAIGFSHPFIDADLRIEAFKEYLRRKDWGIFSLKAVIAHMDKKAAEESDAKAGWHWRPLREMDSIPNVKFGKEGAARHGGLSTIISPASDYFYGAHRGHSQWQPGEVDLGPSSLPYDKLVPLHALRKVKEIEGEFEGEEHVAFFVSDYAPAPHIQYPDPFLMAVVVNARLDSGVGRFVIDFWDEPGFGLEKQFS